MCKTAGSPRSKVSDRLPSTYHHPLQDQPNSFSTPSYSSLPFTPTPPTWLATQSPFASSSTTPLTQNPHSPNPFFPSSSASTPGLPSGNPTLQNPIDTYGYAAGYSRPSQSTDYVLATGSLRLESPYPPPTFDHQPDSSVSQTHLRFLHDRIPPIDLPFGQLLTLLCGFTDPNPFR